MDKSNVTLYCDLEQGNPPTLHAVRWYDYDGNDEKKKRRRRMVVVMMVMMLIVVVMMTWSDCTQLICFNANCHPPCFAEN